MSLTSFIHSKDNPKIGYCLAENPQIRQIDGNFVATKAYDRSNFGVETLGEVVKVQRMRRGITQSRLGQMVGVDSQTISNLEKGRTKSLKMGSLPALAEAIGVPIERIMELASAPKIFGAPATTPAAFGKPAEQFLRDRGIDPSPQPQPTSDLTATLTAGVVVIGEVQAGGLVEPIVYDSDEPDRLPMNVPATGAVALKIVGDSMEPKYQAGEYIICVKINPSEIELNEDVVIQCGSGPDMRATFKRIAGLRGNMMTLKPINGRHKPVKVDRRDVVRVLRVLLVCRLARGNDGLGALK